MCERKRKGRGPCGARISRVRFFPLAIVPLFLLLCLPAQARIIGQCSNCHTMHNSQNGQPMATFGGETGPNPALTRGSCVGCHAQGGATMIVSVGGSEIPQIMHTDGTGDLAGGNFGYIDGTKGSGASDRKGHNVMDIFGPNSDSVLDMPPGWHGGGLNDSTLTCAGHYGCHGTRDSAVGSGFVALRGSHHKNVDGQCDLATETYNSYRFLRGVKGYENQTDKWRNLNATSHNEYFGAATPYVGNADTCSNCHVTATRVQPSSHTISGFCANCHGEFHYTGNNDTEGIGGDIVSPFIRHPTDIVINSKGPASEYAAYTTYNVDAPVGRQVVPAAANNVVTPENDTVTCLSCHLSHASDFPHMLRWDYTKIETGNPGSAYAGTGCLICHSTKDD